MIIKFSELLKYAIAASGQNIVCDMSQTPMDTVSAFNMRYDDLWELFKAEVYRYSAYFPVQKRFNISVLNTGFNVSYDFTNDGNNMGASDSSAGTPPRLNGIKRVVPVSPYGMLGGVSGAALISYMYKLQDIDYASPNRLVIPTVSPYDYFPPLLILTYAGVWDVTCHYDYLITEQRDPSTQLLTEVTIDSGNVDIYRYNQLKRLCLAQFKINVGQARGAFTNTALQMTTSAKSLIEEGEKLYQSTLDYMAKTYPQHLVK